MIIYEGPSRLDGAPIMVIATGIKASSRNAKTGAMIQTWILRSDMPPSEALASGADASICGHCPLRGNGHGEDRGCYVTLWQAPRAIYQAYKAGSYPRATPVEAQEAMAGRKVRLGAYGDPAAAPVALWETILAKASGWTGYTHQWRSAASGDAWRRLLMASADSMHDAVYAQQSGWRTFRVAGDSDRLISEIVCPASAEAGKRTSCEKCGLCMGGSSKSPKSIVIRAHGVGARHVN